jgi:Protein of unknown function (DUF2934)
MEKATEEQIKHRAYELWERAGKPEGRDEKSSIIRLRQELRIEESSPEPDIL